MRLLLAAAFFVLGCDVLISLDDFETGVEGAGGSDSGGTVDTGGTSAGGSGGAGQLGGGQAVGECEQPCLMADVVTDHIDYDSTHDRLS
jgi:hypothetical protein